MTILAGVFVLGKFLRPTLRQKKTLLTLAKTDIPVNGALVYKKARLAIIRDAGKIYALSLVCTHLGCTIAVTPQELICPCHGSIFDLRGNIIKGPADRPLIRHVVEERGEHVLIK